MVSNNDCPAGYTCETGAKELCPAGYFCEEGVNKAICPAGKWSDLLGNKAASDCYECIEGTVVDFLDVMW